MRKVIVEVSARHVHLSQKDLFTLFGRAYKLKKLKALSQPGQFAARETLLAVGPKHRLNIRVVGPVRTKTQVELAISDARILGVQRVFRLSGDQRGSGGDLTLRGPKGRVKLNSGVIIPLRHLHISPEQARAWGLKSGQKVRAIVRSGARPLIFENIIVRSGPFQTRIHLDTDEGNAAGLLTETKIDLDI
ncbi:MAG: propanediol utilization protein [Parcubacteria group bacterium]|nr:MAG: propanediol utilization protein [Parcubacteria group bacterium]